VVSFTPQPLYPQGKRPWYPLHRRLGEPQSQSGPGGEEKNSLQKNRIALANKWMDSHIEPFDMACISRYVS
jgi:hypothetical protein